MKYLILCAFTTFAFSYAAAQQKEKKAEVVSIKKSVKSTSNSGKLYLLSSGEKTTEITKAEYEKIKKKDIDYVRTIKDPALISMYGGKAKQGVVLVVMKGNAGAKRHKHRQG